MRHVNIYTQTSFKGMHKQEGAMGYILEFMTEKGPVTLTKIRCFPNMTPNEAELRVVIEALRRMNEKCEIVIFTESNHVAAGYNFEWVASWKKYGWKTSKGKEITHIKLWQELDRLLEGHDFKFETKNQHSYKKWLTDEVIKEAKKNIEEIK